MNAQIRGIASELLRELKVPLDRLAFNEEEFDPVYAEFLRRAGTYMPRKDVYWALLDARKRGVGRFSEDRRRTHHGRP